jgi:hypothetical protein
VTSPVTTKISHARADHSAPPTVAPKTLKASAFSTETPSASRHAARADGAGPIPPSHHRLPPPLPGLGAVAAFASGAGGGLLLFALFGSLFLLAVPAAARWLRPVLAQGMSPAYVAISDRPG